MALDQKIEQLIVEKTKRTETGMVTILEPSQLQSIFRNTKDILERMDTQGRRTVVVTAPVVRPKFKRIIEQIAPSLTVLSYAEIEPSTEIKIENIVRLT
jgi:flagellar biosynthesis protein FlhA